MLYPTIIILLCLLAEHLGLYAFSGLTGTACNPGAAFGLLGNVPGAVLCLSVLAFMVLVGVIAFGKVRVTARLGLSVMAGGALSNLLERMLSGYVIDWIPVPFMDLYFNLADIEISLGALIAFLSLT